MRWSRGPVALTTAAVALAVAGGAAALVPSRTVVTPLPMQDLALTGRSVAYVTDARPEELHCARIGFWNTRANRRYVFDAKEQCLELTGTGQGVWDVAVATNRLLWITYGGGNIREWTLWTATTTRTKPRQLRFVARDVDARAPIVIGPGTAEGVPYAVDSRIVYLGDDGKAIFKATVDGPVRAIAGGSGPRGTRVAAVIGDSVVVGLDRDGQQVVVWEYTGRVVTAVRVSWRGLVVQAGNDVYIRGTRIRLPSGTTLVDVAEDRILWERAGDVGTTTIPTGKTTLLVDGSPARPALGQLEAQGFAWGRGKLVRWRSGRLP